MDKIVLAQFEFPPGFSSEAKDLISNILTSNPNKRLTLPQIKTHPWLKGIVPSKTLVPTSATELEKAKPKEFTELSPDEYIPAKMDAFEFANCCTGKLLNGLFEIKPPSIIPTEPEIKTEIITNVDYKEYLMIVIFIKT